MFYIKERFNPQFNKPYYKALGELSPKEAKNIVKTKYGVNSILSFKTKLEYYNKIYELRENGYTVL